MEIYFNTEIPRNLNYRVIFFEGDIWDLKIDQIN